VASNGLYPDSLDAQCGLAAQPSGRVAAGLRLAGLAEGVETPFTELGERLAKKDGAQAVDDGHRTPDLAPEAAG
jgi:hypothetical protein